MSKTNGTVNGTTNNVTTTVPVQTWNFTLLRTAQTLTITSESGKVVRTINLKTLESLWDTLTVAEQSVYLPMEDASIVNVPVSYSLTMDEMNAVKGILEKITPVTPESVVAKSAQVVLNGIKGRTHSTVTDKDATYAEHRLSTLENIAIAADQTYYMVQYDIPEVKNEVCPSPCNLLWKYSFRTTKSVWIMPESSLNEQEIIDLFTLWTNEGITFDVMAYDPRETDKIRDKARRMIDEEVRRIHTSLIVNIGNADQQLKEAMAIEGPMTPNTMDKAEEYRDNRVRGMIKIASEALDRSIACAELFDAGEKVSDLLTALRETINSQRATFNARMAQKNRKPV
jgi:hypothetical protein